MKKDQLPDYDDYDYYQDDKGLGCSIAIVLILVLIMLLALLGGLVYITVSILFS